MAELNKNKYLFAELLGTISLPEETKENYCEWVCEPILRFNLAPRWARAVLIIVGYLLSTGMNINTIFMKLLKR